MRLEPCWVLLESWDGDDGDQSRQFNGEVPFQMKSRIHHIRVRQERCFEVVPSSDVRHKEADGVVEDEAHGVG